MAECAHEERQWHRTQCLGGRIGESDRFVREIWEQRCSTCGTVLEEREETLAAALGPLLGASAVASAQYAPTRPNR